jgi:hypothetical protein
VTPADRAGETTPSSAEDPSLPTGYKAPVFPCAAPVCPGHVPYVIPPFHPLRRIYAQYGWNMWRIFRDCRWIKIGLDEKIQGA